MTTKKVPPLIPWNTSIGKECANYRNSLTFWVQLLYMISKYKGLHIFKPKKHNTWILKDRYGLVSQHNQAFPDRTVSAWSIVWIQDSKVACNPYMDIRLCPDWLQIQVWNSISCQWIYNFWSQMLMWYYGCQQEGAGFHLPNRIQASSFWTIFVSISVFGDWKTYIPYPIHIRSKCTLNANLLSSVAK